MLGHGLDDYGGLGSHCSVLFCGLPWPHLENIRMVVGGKRIIHHGVLFLPGPAKYANLGHCGKEPDRHGV